YLISYWTLITSISFHLLVYFIEGEPYGHGKKNLANNMAMLMMLDFLIDQIQEICCKVFSEITGFVNRKALWDCIRSFFGSLKFDSWDDLLRAILAEYSTA
ncbi:MAG: hypothetical protein MK033_07425, partial [Candidatus Caenarcaniphilales bacterium]|nr:hypothetical protein [Candidatus Caenarcaniphilales bacterium]